MDNINIATVIDILSNSDETSSDEGDNLALYAELFSSDSSESSDEDEVLHAKIENFMRTAEAYNENDFKSHFRVERCTADYLTEMYAASTFVPNIGNGGRKRKLKFTSTYGTLPTQSPFGNLEIYLE